MRFVLLLILFSYQLFAAQVKYPTLEIGAQAPDFSLMGVDV